MSRWLLGPGLGLLDARRVGYKTVVTDTFTRADNAGALGNADTGQAWLTIVGNAFGISSNQAYNTDTANTLSIAAIDAGASNVRIACTVTRTTQVAGVAFRISDSSNYWTVNLSGASTTLVKTVAGATTTVATYGSAFSGASDVVVTANGANIGVSVNGELILSASDAFNQTATRHGIFRQQTLNNSRHDNLSIKQPANELSRAAFLSALDAILGDDRLVFLPIPSDAATSADLSALAGTVTHSSSVASRVGSIGTRGVGFTFAPASTQYATLPDAAGLSFGNGLTDSAFSIVFVGTVTDTAASRGIVAKWNVVQEWLFYVTTTDRLELALYDQSSGDQPYRTTNAAISMGSPHVYGVTYSPPGGANPGTGITFYQDATVLASTATASASYVAMEDTAAGVEIGSINGGTVLYGNGTYGLIALCQKALSAQDHADIKALVNRYYGLSL